MNRTTRTWAASLAGTMLWAAIGYLTGHFGGIEINDQTTYGPLAGLAGIGAFFLMLIGGALLIALIYGISEWIDRGDGK